MTTIALGLNKTCQTIKSAKGTVIVKVGVIDSHSDGHIHLQTALWAYAEF